MRRIGWPGVLIAVAAASFCPAAQASPESQQLIRDGANLMGRHDYAGALDDFLKAATADPQDSRAHFFAGAALNRLGRFDEAFLQLRRAKRMGSDHPDLAFETGWAEFGLGALESAISDLERYEAAHRGRGITAELIGRSYLGLQLYDKAKSMLEEAARRDPSLRPNVMLLLAQIDAERGNSPTARDDLQRLLDEEPASSVATALRAQLGAAAQPAGAKPWYLTVSFGGGYNDNVVALGNGLAQPTDISHKDAGFAQLTLDAGYNFTLTDADRLLLSYGLVGDANLGLSAFDLDDHSFRADYRHAFSDRLGATVRLSDELTRIGGTVLRDEVLLRPALGYRAAPWLTLEGAYAGAVDDYEEPPAVPAQNRNGMTHTLSLTAYLTVPGTRLQPRLGYYREWYATRGSDFAGHTDALFLGLHTLIAWNVAADLYYTRSRDRYDNPNSLAGAGFAFARSDDTDRATLQASRPIDSQISIYARFDYTHDESNIQVYKYGQDIYSVGIIASF